VYLAAAITDVLTAIVAVTALAVLIGMKLDSAWLVALGAIIGLVHLVT
jgi:hypothetical protein